MAINNMKMYRFLSFFAQKPILNQENPVYRCIGVALFMVWLQHPIGSD
jgi:hypothetical protein